MTERTNEQTEMIDGYCTRVPALVMVMADVSSVV
jgi:hypothetical protein